MSVVGIVLYINNNHILTKFQHNFKQIVFQKRTKLFQMRTVIIYSNKKPLIFTDKWPNTLISILKKMKTKRQNINHCISKWYFFRNCITCAFASSMSTSIVLHMFTM